MSPVFPDDFDAYGKDLPKATTGQDNLYRFQFDQEGYVVGRVTCLSLEEAEAYRHEHGRPMTKAMPYLRRQAEKAKKPVVKKVRKRKAKKTQPTESAC